MEIKKSPLADLEKYRLTAWLTGLVVVLSVAFVALEYTSGSGQEDDMSDQLDDLAQDFESIPALEQKDMVAAAPAQTSKAMTEKINTVKHTDLVDKLNEDKLNADANISGEGVSASGLDNADASKTTDDTQALSPLPVKDPNNPLNFRAVEELPDFPGGMVEFMKWLRKNLRYPPMARQQKIEGKVVVSFIIGKDGTPAAAKIVTSVDPLLDREALRVVRMLPKWKPGTQKGKPCQTMVCIPIVFKL